MYVINYKTKEYIPLENSIFSLTLNLILKFIKDNLPSPPVYMVLWLRGLCLIYRVKVVAFFTGSLFYFIPVDAITLREARQTLFSMYLHSLAHMQIGLI